MTDVIYPAFRAPDPSRATRTVPTRSRMSSRGTVVAKLPEWGHSRRIVFESKLEQRFIHLALSRADVVDIWDQPSSVGYLDHDKIARRHTFDFLVTLYDDQRLAVIVKPYHRASRMSFRELVKTIAAATPPTFADQVVVFTDQSFTKIEAANAKKLFEARQCAAEALDDHVANGAAALHEPTSIRQFLTNLHCNGVGYAAALRAIADGVLTLVDDTLLSPESRVVTGGLS